MSREELAAIARRSLDGVGDESQQWEEWTGYAYHIRRRLTPDEQAMVGDAVDLRGTDEARKRYCVIRPLLPPEAVALAIEELGVRPLS